MKTLPFRLARLRFVGCLGFLVALATCVQANVTNVVWYRLGEDDPGAAAGLAATNTVDLIGLRDLKPFGSPLYTGAVSTNASDHVGSSLAVQFNGSSQYFSNSVVSIATNNFGIEAWVKPNSVTSTPRFIAYNGDTTGDGWGIYQNRTNYFGVFGGVAQIGGTAATATAGTWTHVALVRDSGVTALFINGVVNGHSTNVPPRQVVKGDAFAIGAAPQAPPGGAFSGVIDEVRVFTFGTGQFRTSDLLVNLQRITAQPASAITRSNATLNGTAGLAGLPTSAWFEWGPTTNYGNTTAIQSISKTIASTNFSDFISNLVPGATYQFRAAVSNSLGVGYGDNLSLTTLPPPLVTNTADSGPGSLRQVVSDAGAGDFITFAPGLAGTITFTNGPLVVDKSLNMIGPGARILFLSSAGAGTVLQFTGGNANVSGLTVTDGGDLSGDPAINNNANLVLGNCEVVGNRGVALGQNSNNLVLLNCSIVGNTGGGLVIAPGATAAATNCTFFENYGLPSGGAIFNQGTLTLLSCTVALNAGNNAAGGIYSTGTAYIGNTILAKNYAFPGGVFVYQDAVGTFNSLGYNFIAAGDGSTGFTNGVNQDQVGTSATPLDPRFSGIIQLNQYNGGPTMNLLPDFGSPLIDRGNSFGVTTDQRGFARPLDFPQLANASGGDGSDIGAVEYGSGLPCSDCATQVTVDASQTLRPADGRWFGANVASFVAGFDTPNNLSLLTEMGCRSLRFPGGGMSDEYDWRTGVWTGHGTQPTTFANFMHIATNLPGVNVFITVNYGTGTTNEAADWVSYANITNHCGFKYWELGNECYSPTELDNNTNPPYQPHDPWTYAMRFRDYYTAMKAVDPTIKVGAVVTPGEDTLNYFSSYPALNPRTGLTHNGWTPVLLTTLKSLGVTPDFLIHHFYAEYGVESDPILLQSAAQWANDAAELRQEISDYFGDGGTNIELVCTENNSDASYHQGKQSTSLVNGLFLADSLGRLMKTELNSWLWWLFESHADTTGNFSSSLYGWRTYGDFGLALNANTRYPTSYALELMHDFVQPGDTILDTGPGYPFLDVFAAKTTNGVLSVLVINKARTNIFTRQITLAGFSPSAAATVLSYGIPQDEATRTNGSVMMQDIATNHMTIPGGDFTYAFPPYSMTLFTLVPTGPVLTVSRPDNTTVLISWPWPSAGWHLQQNTDLGPTNWSTPSEMIQNDGTNNFIIVASPIDTRFYRLKSP
jgi:alpha-L-arabinofuranosidase